MATKVKKRPGTSVERAAAASTERVIDHWISRALPLLAAPLAFVLLIPAIVVLHNTWGGDPTTTPFFMLAVFVMGAIATAYTFYAAGNRKHLGILSTVTAAAVTLALVVGLVIGFGPMASIYGLVALFLSVLWGVRHAMKWGGAEEGTGGGHNLGRLGEVIDSERFTLKKLKAGGGNGVIKGEVVAEVGATIEEFQAMAPVIAAAAKAPTGAVTVTVDPDDSSVGHFRMTVADLLKFAIPFDPYLGAGQSVIEAVDVGRYEHGDPVQIEITAHDNGVIEHLLVMGVSGAGKSAFARALITRLLLRSGVAVIGVDVAKGLQTFGCIAHGMAMVITDMGQARRFIKVMSARVLKARFDHLAGEGLDYWTPESALTFLVVWLEEAADLFSTKDAYDELLRKARSAGVWIVSSLQRASHENLSTDARANHGASACFGVRDMTDASFALPDEVVDAGAAPTWRTAKPGYHYLTGLRTDAANWAAKTRGYDTRDKAALAAAVTAGAAHRTPLDSVTTDALGPIWEDRTIYDGPVGVNVPDLPHPSQLAPQFDNQADTEVTAVVRHVLDALASHPDQPAEDVIAAALREALADYPNVDTRAVLEALTIVAEQARAQATNPQASAKPNTAASEKASEFASGKASRNPSTHTGPPTSFGSRPAPATSGFSIDTHDQDDEDEDEMSAAEQAEMDELREEYEDAMAEATRTHLTGQGLADEHPTARLDSEIPGSDDIDLPLDEGRGAEVTLDQARDLFEAQLAAWLAKGKSSFTVADMDKSGLLERMGRERTWFYRNRDRYEDAGIIASVPEEIGVYDILRSPHDQPVPA